MDYNQPSEFIKDLTFGDEAKNKIMTGVDKLAQAVKSTLGASGKCVIKTGIETAVAKVNDYLSKKAIDVTDDKLEDVSSISCNNDRELGIIISDAYKKVGKQGVVLMETSETEDTYIDVVDGAQFEGGITSPHFVTNQEKKTCVLENPLVLVCGSEIENIRKIQSILEYVIKNKKELLIVASVDKDVKSALMMNKVKGNIKVNIIDPPGFGVTKHDTMQDLAFLTGATLIDERLGDDMDLLTIDCLGKAKKSVTDAKNTVVTTLDLGLDLSERIDSVKKVKEKRDRVEDAIYATKAALQEGIVAGGGIALLNASQEISASNEAELILFKAIKAPYNTILDNAGIEHSQEPILGHGIDVTSGKTCDMVKTGIIDPVLVTKSALKNAVSVVSTIISADCIISNIRVDESNK